MEIAVVFSIVPDTTTHIKLSDSQHPDTTGIQWIINPWDELALTRAIELKEDAACAVNNVSVIHVGMPETEPVVRKALAMGADKAILIQAEPSDAYFVAVQLAAVLKDKSYDLILAGIESSDYNGAAVGGMLSEFIDIPSVSAVSGISINGEDITVTRDIDGGKEILVLPVPFVAIIQKGIAKEPRMPSMRGLIMARKKPVNIINPVKADPLTVYERFDLPKPKPPCKMIDPDHPEQLLDLLQDEAKVIHL